MNYIFEDLLSAWKEPLLFFKDEYLTRVRARFEKREASHCVNVLAHYESNHWNRGNKESCLAAIPKHYAKLVERVLGQLPATATPSDVASAIYGAGRLPQRMGYDMTEASARSEFLYEAVRELEDMARSMLLSFGGFLKEMPFSDGWKANTDLKQVVAILPGPDQGQEMPIPAMECKAVIERLLGFCKSGLVVRVLTPGSMTADELLLSI